MITLFFVVGTAGCSKDEEPAVASAGPGAVQASAGDGERSALRYSQCMRDQGLTWFPDPDAEGNLTVHNPDGVDQDKLDKAEQACRKYAPWEGPKHPIPAEDLDKIRQVSQCMREHGFEKYPDPDAYGSVRLEAGKLGADPDSVAFRTARQECDKYMPRPKSSPGS
ncbi:hypothetical protein [Actinoplanes regularis]|uniref:hypothetical protein n=1 Tax=Actinoplanes regularis TaxID=52697 RepID=UPI002552E1F7|nr:hypothetical protein [Actinoplanes regularis]GLW27707.1 hypothetical protein Areg01_06470 [Actinoplanes regularis]